MNNVISKKETRNIINDTLIEIASIVGNSLGPYGYNTIIEDPLANHVITKDGYTILNKIKYEDEVADTILAIIKKISRSLVREVGDGSTSSIVIASDLYNEIDKILSSSLVSPKIIMSILQILEKILEKKIKDKAIKIDSNNYYKLEDIATISNNNDRELGKLVADIYRKLGSNGFITLENSKTSEDKYEIKDGYEIERGYIDSVFANQKNKVDFIAENPLIFIANDTLTEEDREVLLPVLQFVMQQHTSLVIIAKGYDKELFEFLRINKFNNKNALDIVALDYSLASYYQRDMLEDFAIYCGCTIYDKYNQSNIVKKNQTYNISDLGKCKKVIIDEKTSKFIEGYGKDTDNYKARVDFLKKDLAEKEDKEKTIDSSEEVYKAKKRLSLMENKTATFYVGGDSEIEKENRKFLLEDSIYACQSALRNGYIIGGNLIIPIIITEDFHDIISEVTEKLNEVIKFKVDESIIIDVVTAVYESFKNSFFKVLSNFRNNPTDNQRIINHCISNKEIYNVLKDEYESLDSSNIDTTIINSPMTDIEIMKSTFSIIGLLATSNQFICRSTYRPIKK